MNFKRLWSALLAFVLAFSCFAVPVSAAEIPDSSTPILRVSERVSFRISANTISLLSSDVSLAAGDIIKFDCTYTPTSASVDFGYVDSNQVFHYLNCTSGSIDKSFKVSKSGQYTLAVRNNESYSVTVTGMVKY